MSQYSDRAHGIELQAVDGWWQGSGGAASVAESRFAEAQPAAAGTSVGAPLEQCGFHGECSVPDLEGGEHVALAILVVCHDRDTGGLRAGINVDGDFLD